MLNKNDIVTLEIEGLTNEGNGVGRALGVTVFVPYTAVGDIISCRIVKVKKSFCYGIIDSLIKPSDTRCDSGCKAYGKCGGCCFRHVKYECELKEKEGFVKNAFTRIGKLSPKFEPIIASERVSHYRNKAQFPVAADQNGRLYCGFYAKRSHRATEANCCDLLPEIFTLLCDDIINFANENAVTAYNEQTGCGLLRHIFMRKGEHSSEIMTALVLTDIAKAELFRPLAKMLAEKYSKLRSFIINENSADTNVILGKKSVVLYGGECIYDEMCGNKIAVGLHSFYQINTLQAERIYRLAEEYAGLTGGETLLDLYCGAGTIGLSMAKKCGKLIGIEVIPQAIENAKQNAALNGIENAEFICADAGKAARLLYERGETPDVIIADPARKGCTPDTLEYMVKMNPKKIVMISCNPATAARDCAALNEMGYQPKKCRAADFFPRTSHVETVCLLSRNK